MKQHPTTQATGSAACAATLFDERSRPDFRDVYGQLLRSARQVRIAVTRVRLSTLDLTRADVRGIASMRVLVAELNALTLDAEARMLRADPRRAYRLELYRRLLESGTLEVRSAPLGGWSPDYSVFSSPSGPDAVLLGFHWFERPYPHRGPAFASLHRGPPAIQATERHEELWSRAHDVGPAIWSILSKASRPARLETRVSG
jgi:hypothetical protein